jgi:ribosomal protein S18 acetylase RimI-like enzyme
MPLSIRIAAKKDAALIADLSRKTFYETFDVFNTKEDMDKFMNEQFTHDALMNEVGAEGNIFLLAFDDELPVGYARMRENNNPPELQSKNAMEISRIYADSNSIGKGVGKTLMEKCIAIAKEKNKEIIWLGVWEKNERAIDFYHKWGFEKFSEHPFILGNDIQTDWLLKKNLF